MTTSGFHSRVNDHALSLGLERYSTGAKDTDKYLWKFVVSEFCDNKRLLSFEVSISDLTKIKTICDQAIKELQSDGGRKTSCLTM